MVEPEMAFYDLNDNMDLAEAFLKRIFQRRAGATAPRTCSSSTSASTRTCIARLEERRSTARSAACRTPRRSTSCRSRARRSSSRSTWGNDLQAEHERYLTEKHFKSPVILYDYPRTIKPFYMRVNDDGKTVRAMDVLVPGVGEIIGGSQREERLDVLEAADARAGPRPGRLLVVPRPAPLRHRAARRLRPGPGADGAVRHRHGATSAT